MKTYTVIVSRKAVSDIDGISTYVAKIYRPDSGHKFVNRILGQLASLSYTADIYQKSPYTFARNIHPDAKSVPIIHHRWTVVFHTERQYVMIDRIIPSKMMM
ncbi:MAG: type II toxin-antitoxin system RelE/ParE family toxin [Bacteroidales bacterium]|nr:type II toxin-antitoxin system RelE/ParE family toxin [Bacteroidales bacterium]